MRFHKYGVLLAFLALGATLGCDGQRVAVGGPSPFSASLSTGTSFRFEPSALHAELVPGTSCVGGPAFGTRIIIVVVGAGHDFVLSGLRFRFTDRFGVDTLPRVTPIPGSSPLSVPASTIRSGFPIPMPGIAPLPMTSPIPMPGSSNVNGLLITVGTSLHLPFFLFFDCGIASEGLLFFNADVTERDGSLKTTEFRVRVGA